MTDAYPESIELRLSMSAETIGDLWALRCGVRGHAGLDQAEPARCADPPPAEVPGGHLKAAEPNTP